MGIEGLDLNVESWVACHSLCAVLLCIISDCCCVDDALSGSARFGI